jgi:NADH:ubiquinone oxidoreductase subunit 4 (subunit M)
MLRFFQGVMAGPPSELVEMSATASDAPRARRARARGLADLRGAELAVLLPLLVLIVALGIAPGALTARMESSVRPLTLTPAGIPAGITGTSGSSPAWPDVVAARPPGAVSPAGPR